MQCSKVVMQQKLKAISKKVKSKEGENKQSQTQQSRQTAGGLGAGDNNTQQTSTEETKAKNKFLETVGKTTGKVFNSKAAKAVKNTYAFAGKHIAPAIIRRCSRICCGR